MLFCRRARRSTTADFLQKIQSTTFEEMRTQQSNLNGGMGGKPTTTTMTMTVTVTLAVAGKREERNEKKEGGGGSGERGDKRPRSAILPRSNNQTILWEGQILVAMATMVTVIIGGDEDDNGGGGGGGDRQQRRRGHIQQSTKSREEKMVTATATAAVTATVTMTVTTMTKTMRMTARGSAGHRRHKGTIVMLSSNRCD